MEALDSQQLWLLIAAVAVGAFMLGRMTGGESPEDRAARRMQERQEIENAFANLSPDVQQEIDALIARRKKIEAIKRFREATGRGLKESKDAVEHRQAMMSGV